MRKDTRYEWGTTHPRPEGVKQTVAVLEALGFKPVKALGRKVMTVDGVEYLVAERFWKWKGFMPSEGIEELEMDYTSMWSYDCPTCGRTGLVADTVTHRQYHEGTLRSVFDYGSAL
jgi:hypothetical protein